MAPPARFPKELMEELYVRQGKTSVEIAAMLGTKPHIVCRCLRRWKIPTRRPVQPVIFCLTCGKQVVRRHKKDNIRGRKYCDRACYRAQPLSPNIKSQYRKQTRGGTHGSLHRNLMEQILGRKLKWHEFVHHKNGNTLDNRPENLEIMDPVTHGRHHHLKYPLTKLCEVCGVEYTPPKTQRKIRKTCSKACRFKMISITLKKRFNSR